MKRLLLTVVVLMATYYGMNAREIHVAKTGNDSNSGTETSPYLTISKAALVAISGDVVVVHQGTYREYVNPLRGGTSDLNRIIYRPASGQEVFVKGSEEINNWQNVGGNVWKVTLQASYFGGYNPYNLFVNGDFQTYGKWHHRGDIYLNNGVLNELQTREQVEKEGFTWYTTSTASETTIYANFGTSNPNTELAEINVRELIFFATRIEVDYLTIQGFRFLHAAPNWQAPNEGPSDPNRLTQVGAVGSNMGKGWIIENCEVMYSKTAGIMMGESADNQNTFEDVEAFGNHIIRNNIIHRCGEYGIAGQKGLARSTISGNRVEDINYRDEFGGYETAGIKIWNSVDVHIENNLIRNCIASQTGTAYCLWIDYANQGTRISRNFLVGSQMTRTVLFLEANIGPTLVDNNVFVDRTDKAIEVYSGGSVFAHNLFINSNFSFAIQQFENGGSGARNAYTLEKHTMRSTGGRKVEIENNKLYNNIFAGGAGPSNFNVNTAPGSIVDNNLYIGGTNASLLHTNYIKSNSGFSHTITDTQTGINFTFTMDNSFQNMGTPYVNANLIGIIPFANQSIEDKFGNPITVNTDFNFANRTGSNPKVGPLENMIVGTNTITIGTNKQLTTGAKYTVPQSIAPSVAMPVQTPYSGTPYSIPGTIEAENYDVGGQGVAFNDDLVKEGLINVRPADKVDLGGGGENGVVVGWFGSGEWLEYTVAVEPGIYEIVLSAASGLTTSGNLKITVDNQDIATINVSGTSDWNNYQTFLAQNVSLQASGAATLRISTTGGFNVDKIKFIKTGPLPTAQTPFTGTPYSIPGTIEAENYDFGGQGVAFNDDLVKEGLVNVRPGDPVDLGSNGGNEVVVGWFGSGEWLEYTVAIEAGTYSISLSAASGLTTSGNLKITVDNQDIATINVSGTSGWNTYQTFLAQNVTVPVSGTVILRISTTGGFNVDKINFVKTGSLLVQTPYLGTPYTIPGIIEAENYDVGGQGVSFNDDLIKEGLLNFRSNDKVDVGSGGGNGFVVGWFGSGEWLEYTVASEPGTYDIYLSAASGLTTSGNLKITLNDQDIATINVSGTSDWNNYQTFLAQNVSLGVSGKVILKISTTGGFNVDKITFVKTSSSSGSNGLRMDNTGSPTLGLLSAKKSEFKIYPNPVKDVLNVQMTSDIIPLLKVYNLEGKLLLSKKAVKIDVSQLSKGIYFLFADDNLTAKFIKE